MAKYNIYCDESCHLPKDNSDIMVIGGISCPREKTRMINHYIMDIKTKHDVFRFAEIKWTKVSMSKVEMYKDIIDLFFDNSFLQFRAVVATEKKKLELNKYNLSYDDWYQRIYYLVLREMISVESRYDVYVDIKDTKGSEKIDKLRDVLNNAAGYFYEDIVEDIQLVRSDQIQLLQLTDLLIGAVSYKNRDLNGNKAKLLLIDHIEKRSGRSLHLSSPKSEDKFNIFKWAPRRS